MKLGDLDSKFCDNKMTFFSIVFFLGLNKLAVRFLLHAKRSIMITHPCNIYPLASHFYIIKLEFTGVFIIFLLLLKNIDCGYSLEAILMCTHNLCFEQKMRKFTFFHWQIIFFTAFKNRCILHRQVCVMLIE